MITLANQMNSAAEGKTGFAFDESSFKVPTSAAITGKPSYIPEKSTPL